MRILILVIFLLAGFTGMSQNFSGDIALVAEKLEKKSQNKPDAFKGLLKVYHNHFSNQIINDCVYEHSCSEFGQQVINKYGVIKGLILTCDRLTRCNQASLAETPPSRLTEKGKIKDHWDDYK